MIKRSALVVCCGAVLLGNAMAQDAVAAEAAVDKAALVEEAKGAVMALGSSLQGELKAALEAGGPVNAIDVCHSKAPELARQVSQEKNFTVTRVSLKNRNPVMGEPNDWQQAVLEDFEARRAAGEDPKPMAYADVVDGEFRFMKAIPTQAVCLKCHGVTLAPDLAAKIAKLYPADEATGFSEGDIRGAFVVTRDLSK